MKKALSFLLSISLFFTCPAFMSVQAEELNTTVKTVTGNSILEILRSENKSYINESLPIDFKTIDGLLQSPEVITNYDSTLLKYELLDKVSYDTIEQILQNGTNVVVYGDDIDFPTVVDFFGDGLSSIEDDTDAALAAVIVCMSYMGDLSYSFILKDYATGSYAENIETGEIIEVPQPSNKEPHDIVFTKEELVKNLLVTNEMETELATRLGKTAPIPDDDCAYIQVPPNATQRFFHPDTLSIFDNNEDIQCMSMYSSIYLYDKGRPTYDTGLRQWDMLTYNILTCINGYIPEYIDVTLNGNYYNQKFQAYSHLNSQASIGATVSLGASLNSSGVVTGSGSIGTSYSINTSGLDIDNYPNVAGSSARWKGVGPGRSQVQWYPTQGLDRNGSLTLEAVLTVEGENRTGAVQGGRSYTVGCIEYTDFALWANSIHYTRSEQTFKRYYTVYK